jgi:hypothetical protein
MRGRERHSGKALKVKGRGNIDVQPRYKKSVEPSQTLYLFSEVLGITVTQRYKDTINPTL